MRLSFNILRSLLTDNPPSPGKIGHTPTQPYSFRKVVSVLLRPRLKNQISAECCGTGTTVFRPYPRRLESLTVCRFYYKDNTSFLLS